MKLHAVLNATCHVHILGLGEDPPLPAFKQKLNFKQRGIPDQALKAGYFFQVLLIH